MWVWCVILCIYPIVRLLNSKWPAQAWYTIRHQLLHLGLVYQQKSRHLRYATNIIASSASAIQNLKRMRTDTHEMNISSYNTFSNAYMDILLIESHSRLLPLLRALSRVNLSENATSGCRVGTWVCGFCQRRYISRPRCCDSAPMSRQFRHLSNPSSQ